MNRNDGPFPKKTPPPLGWCDMGGQHLGWGCKAQVGDRLSCEDCGKPVTIVGLFGDHGYPAYPRHKLPTAALSKPPVQGSQP